MIPKHNLLNHLSFFLYWVKTCCYLIVPTLHRHYSALVQVKKLLYALMWSLTIKVLNPQDISNIFHFTSEIWSKMWKISKIKMDRASPYENLRNHDSLIRASVPMMPYFQTLFGDQRFPWCSPTKPFLGIKIP
jgi:hypothetical protein